MAMNERSIAINQRKPGGQKQSSTQVINPVPAKKTSIARKGIRKNKG